MKTLCCAISLIVTLAVSLPVRAYVTAKSRSTAGAIVEHKWRAFPITWQMNPTQGSNVSGDRSQEEVLSQSFQAWQSVGTAALSLQEGQNTDAALAAGYDGVNLITTNSSSGLNLPPGVLAVTLTYYFDDGGPGIVDQFGRPVEAPGQIMEADMVFGSTSAFSTSVAAVANRIDLQSVATHEAGHLLGLDHASNLSSTMFWGVTTGVIYPRILSADDIAGISSLYPTPAFAMKGKLSGAVRTTTNVPVYGAIVVAVNSSGVPVASTVTDPNGAYLIEGLDAGVYTVMAEPLSGRISAGNITSLETVNPDQTVNTNFTSRYK